MSVRRRSWAEALRAVARGPARPVIALGGRPARGHAAPPSRGENHAFFRIEAAGAQDRATLIALTAALQAHERRIERMADPAAPSASAHVDALVAWILREGGGTLIARAEDGSGNGAGNGAPIGLVVFGLERAAPPADARRWRLHGARAAPPIGRISDLYVAAEARGRGVGAALLRAAEEELAALGAERTEVTALAANDAARAAYQSLGYRPYTVTYSRKLRG